MPRGIVPNAHGVEGLPDEVVAAADVNSAAACLPNLLTGREGGGNVMGLEAR